MNVKATVLSENSVLPGMGTVGEHGLSLLVERGDKRILFDTGQGMALPHNAKIMGIDLSGLDAIVLSHGHYDHTGGLEWVLGQTGPVPVYIAPGLFDPKFIITMTGDERAIGIPYSRQDLEKAGAKFVTADKPTEVAEGITVTGPVPRESADEYVEPILMVRNESGELVPDSVPDDMSLVLDTDRGTVLLTGCAHAGLINTIEHAKRIAKTDRLTAIIGGTHLVFATDDRVQATVDALIKTDVEMLAPAHCTGFRALGMLQAKIADKLLPCSVGSEFTF